MRIVIAAPPKAGNSWIRCILGAVYNLQGLSGAETPRRVEPEAFRAWTLGGGFRDGTIFHQHYPFSDAFADAVANVPAHIVTIIRDPYDVFVSTYHFVQAQADNERRAGRERARRSDVMIGKPIDHPDVLGFLERDFRVNLARANEWVQSGRSLVIRYEDLYRDPVTATQRLTERIEPIPVERIARAVEACRAENVRRSKQGLSNRIRTATVGDWRNHLSDAHLDRFRSCHGDLLERLGYEVR